MYLGNALAGDYQFRMSYMNFPHQVGVICRLDFMNQSQYICLKLMYNHYQRKKYFLELILLIRQFWRVGSIQAKNPPIVSRISCSNFFEKTFI